MKQPDRPAAVEPGAANRVVEDFKSLYHALNAENCRSDIVNNVYSRDMYFEDPFHRVEGLRAFKEYCASLYENLTHCQFRFHDQWAREGDAILTWTMSYAHPKLNGGREIRVEGMSWIIFDEKVFYHRDYFDGGALLYEHIPLLGGIIRSIKRKLG